MISPSPTAQENTPAARLFLSPPHMGGDEIRFVREAFDSNYIAPLGPQVDAFEREFSEYTGIRHCVALSSGTAAMHLALQLLGAGPGDEVFVSTLTFIGSVSPVTFLGAILFVLLAACQARHSLLKPPLEHEGQVFVYLRAMEPEAGRLTFRLGSVSAVRADGDEVALVLHLREIRGRDAKRERLLASGNLPPGQRRWGSPRPPSRTSCRTRLRCCLPGW